MNTYNAETANSRIYAAMSIARTAGIPFDTTSSLNTALNYPVILLGSRINDNAFDASNEAALIAYVNNGGVLIHSSLRDTSLFNLCGVSTSSNSTGLYFIDFDTIAKSEYFHLINDSLEVRISLGDSTSGSNYALRKYTLSTGISLGNFEDLSCALAYNAFGNGHVYTFGPDLRDLIIRNQLDFDVNAHRTYSNGFEPSSDVIVFLIRNIFRKHVPNLVYTHTSPGNSSSVVLLTHDIDSWSAMDTMGTFSQWEVSQNIPAHYNITTRYTNDGWMTSFYVGSWTRVENIMDAGHTIASHSVGHFPDFADESRFPYGTTGNVPANYQPFYTGGITTGGTVIGELEVSKNLLFDDHALNIRSFRAGHLAYHDSLTHGLQQLNYEFNSTQSANNVLTGFPYYDLKVRSFSGIESSILEIPMTISDVFSSNPIDTSNYLQKVSIWANATRKYAANNAPITLLIHPNRLWKLTAQQRYFDSIPEEVLPYSFEAYGEFWRKRDSLKYRSELNGDTLEIHLENNQWSNLQSFVVDATSLDTVLFYDQLGNPLSFAWQNFPNGLRLYFAESVFSAINTHSTEELKVEVYPNPTQNEFFIKSPVRLNGTLSVFDLSGRQVYSSQLNDQQLIRLDLSLMQINTGIYSVFINDQHHQIRTRIVYLK